MRMIRLVRLCLLFHVTFVLPQAALGSWLWSSQPKEYSLYELIGVPIQADEATIKKAYRERARELHPDKHPNAQDEATKKFAELGEAYKVLTCITQRDIYDRLGKGGLQRFRDGDPSVKPGWRPGVFASNEPAWRQPDVPGWDSLDDFVTSAFAWAERVFARQDN